MPFATHAEYFASVPEPQRARLLQIQLEVERRIPSATRCISYNMPAFKQGKTFFYFATFKKHIGIYPPVRASHALAEATAAFRGPKGNLQFPHDTELPVALIGQVAEALAAQYAAH